MHRLVPIALLAGPWLHAGELLAQDSPRAVLEKAIGAHGGERLARARTMIRISKGEIGSGPQAVPVSSETYLNLPDQGRWSFELMQNDQKVMLLLVINRDQGWQSSGGAVKDLPPRQLDELLEENYVAWLTTLVPLLDRKFDLAALPEAKVGNEPAVGIKAASKGKPDVALWFGKQTGLLVKAEYKGREAGQLLTKEFIFGSFKDFDGIRMPARIEARANGQRIAEWHVTSYRFPERVDEAAFAKP